MRPLLFDVTGEFAPKYIVLGYPLIELLIVFLFATILMCYCFKWRGTGALNTINRDQLRILPNTYRLGLFIRPFQPDIAIWILFFVLYYWITPLILQKCLLLRDGLKSNDFDYTHTHFYLALELVFVSTVALLQLHCFLRFSLWRIVDFENCLAVVMILFIILSRTFDFPYYFASTIPSQFEDLCNPPRLLLWIIWAFLFVLRMISYIRALY